MAVQFVSGAAGFTATTNFNTFITTDFSYLTDSGDAFDFADTNNNAYLLRGTVISDNGDGIDASSLSFDNDVVIATTGIVIGNSDGIDLNGNDHTVTNNGKVVGRVNEGVEFGGDGNTLWNYGEIVAQQTGVEVDGDNNAIWNHGQISAHEDDGVDLDGNNNRLVNTGEIVSLEDAGVRIRSLAGEINFVTNTGLIFGRDIDGNAIVGEEGDETISNQGTIDGNVSLGGGNDLFDGIGGTVNGTVSGGAGDDTYNVDDPTITLIENVDEGFDTVNAETSFELGDNFERLNLLGDGDFSGVGNGLDNIISGNIGDNVLDGKGGDDVIRGHEGDDTLLGGGGDDRLIGGPGDDTLFGGPGEDNMLGGAGSDTLNGGNGDDRLVGGGGGDVLRGGNGDDRLLGTSGADALVGGFGSDILIGGADADRFVYNSALETPVGAGRDRINDFTSGQGDLIDVSGIDANVNTGADDSFTFIGQAAFTGVAGQLRFDSTLAGNSIVSGDIDGDGVADFEIFVADNAVLTAGDFLL